MKTLALIITLAICNGCFAGVSATNSPTGPAYKVHGRLSVYCGNPSCRIWIVGTKRILGVAESAPPEVSFMPSKLSALLTPGNLIFGDFTVVPLTEDEEGVMRIVRVITAENLVITDGNLEVIGRVKEKIQGEPIKIITAQRASRVAD